QDGQPGRDVRRGAGLSVGPPGARQHPHLGTPHQHRARPAATGLRDGPDPLVARLYEERPDPQAEASQWRAAFGERQRGPGGRHRGAPDARLLVGQEQEGGAFSAPACMVVMRAPASGWINYGAYRIQSQGPDVATVMMSPGKHGRILMTKYHARREPCPVAVVAGMHPALFMLAGLEIPYGKSEFEAAGGLLGEPVEVFNMPKTG